MMAIRLRLSILFLVFCYSCLTVFGQSRDQLVVDNYLLESDSFGLAGDFKNAIVARKKALNLQQAAPTPSYADLVANYRTIGYYLRRWGKIKDSRFYQKKAVELAEKNLTDQHPELAKAYNGLGGYHFGRQEFEQAFLYFQQALNISLLASSNEIGDYYNNVGIAQQALGNPEQAMSTYQMALAHNLNTIGFFHAKTADNYDNIGTLYYNLNNFEIAVAYLDSAEIILDSLYDKGAIHFAGLYNNKGAVYNRMGNYHDALNYLEKSLGLYERYGSGNHPETANIYANIGLLLQDRGDLDKALAYFQKALAIRVSNFGTENPKVGRTHLYLGDCYLEKLDFERAFLEFQESLSIYNSLNQASNGEIAEVYNSLGSYYEKMNNPKKALSQYDEALHINSANIGRNDPDVANSYAKIGNVHLSQKKYKEARSYFEKALKIRENVYGLTHADVAISYAWIAQTCEGETDCISQHLDKAYRAIGYTPGNTPKFDLVYSPISLLKIMQADGGLSIDLYEKEQNTQQLEHADLIFNRAIALIDFIKNSLEQPGSRLALQDNFYQIYEDAIRVKYMLHQISGDENYLNGAFTLAEKSNAILLMEALQTVEAEQFAGIPDSLIRLERTYKIELSYLEKQRYEEELKGDLTNPSLLKEINNRIFDVHLKQSRLIGIFQKKHPDYFRLKYERPIISVKDIQQNLLREDQTMLAYFVGEHYIFAFIIGKEQFELIQINKDFPLEIWVEEFRNSIYRFSPADNNSAYLNQKLANIGHELYQLIFAPLAAKIKTDALVIVPGGVLGYLPFDALLSSATENYDDFDNFDYLIKQYSISYSYSATLLEEMVSEKHHSKPFIAFAPAYFGDTLNVSRSNDPWRAVLGQLRFNTEEAEKIHELMGGQLYIDSAATEAKFLEVASTAGILHLATHGKSNDRNGDYSYLAFFQTQDTIENELLFVKNLYDMHIPASLVVLSACETGIGELQRGEGIVSLARGFSYAGAASIVTTLWSIDDNASAKIMIDFYQYLKDGDPKDIAIRKAKLAYIEKNKGNNRTHPLFWAAFVPVGNMQPLSAGFPVWIYAIIAFLLLTVGWKVYQKR